MKLTDAYPSRFLSAADAEDEDLTLTIRDVTMEKLGDDEKPVAWFKELGGKNGKGLVINKTNWQIIAGMLGDDSDDWLGQKITIAMEKVQYAGKMVPSLRVQEQRKRKNGTGVNAAPAGKSQIPPPDPVDEGDDAPF
jgi:hypothetical protein